MDELENNNHALYISIGGVLFVVLMISIWMYNSVKSATDVKNTDPTKDFVCIENSCSVKKICDVKALVIYTTPPNGSAPTKQRIPNSIECQSN